jgi:hypothetical protein
VTADNLANSRWGVQAREYIAAIRAVQARGEVRG